MARLTDIPSQVRFSYLSALDPWRESNRGEVERLLKMASLTARRVVISDNQALNNLSLNRLLARPDVYDFFSTPDVKGNLPMTVALRHGTSTFEDVAERLVLNRDRPAIFPWMSAKQQMQLDESYSGGKNKDTTSLYHIAGNEFRQHVDRLNGIIKISSSHVTWTGLEDGYVDLASASLRQFRDAILSQGGDLGILSTCDGVIRAIEERNQVNRSNLYRIIDESKLSHRAKLSIRLKGLDEPYHQNFAASGDYNIITGSEYANTNVVEMMGRIAERIRMLRPIDVFEIEQFPVFLDQVPFERIGHIRSSHSFHSALDRIASTESDEDRVQAVVDLLNLISGELAKEPVGIRKLNRLRLHLVRTPNDMADELARAGLTLSDVVAATSKAAGFLVGEATGMLVGVFALGGILGTGAAIVVEQLSEGALGRPKRQAEFQQVLQFLTKVAQHTRDDRGAQASSSSQGNIGGAG